MIVDCDGCVVVGESGRAAALGLRNTVVVHAQGGTLSCPLDRVEEVRRLVEAMRAEEAER